MNFNHLLDYRALTYLSQMNDAGRTALCAEILDRPPSEKTWQALLELFAVWPENDAKSRQLDIAEERLANWDDSLRRADSSKAFLYEGQGLSSLTRLIKSIEIYRREERGTAELMALANSRFATRLISLSIFDSEIAQRGWQALAQSPFVGELRHLHVSKTVLTDLDLETLFQSSSLSRLQCLKLIGVGLSPKQVQNIPSSIPFPNVQRVDFSSNALGDDGAEILSRCEWLSGIRVLRLRHNHIRAEGIKTLLESPSCREVNEIDLSENQVTDAEKSALLSLATKRNKRLLL